MRRKIFSVLYVIFLFVFMLKGIPALCEVTDIQNSQGAQEVVEVVQNDVNTQEVQDERVDVDKLNEEMGLGEQRQIVIDDVESSPNDNIALTKKVVPDTHSELVKMAKMFLKVMVAVAISSVIIFVLLLFVRRFYTPVITIDDLNRDDSRKISLDTPQNKNEALKTFLDKTRDM